MGIVDANAVNLAYAIEDEESPGALPTAPKWFNLEPNNITTFGADISTIERNPISKSRQRQKGEIVDLDASVEFDADLTLSSFLDFAEGFVFSKRVNSEVTDLAVTAVTNGSYTLAVSVAVGQPGADYRGKLGARTLVWAQGFGILGNNGLKMVSAAPAAMALQATGLATEGKAGTVSLAGYRTDGGVAWSKSGVQGTMNATGLGTALEARGLTLGQIVHLGSPDGSHGLAADTKGYARVVKIDADTVTFDKLGAAVAAVSAGNTPGDTDILFGQFIRNVSVDDTNYQVRDFQFELEYPRLADDGNASEYEYAVGCRCNSLGISLPLTDKVTMTAGFVALDAGFAEDDAPGLLPKTRAREADGAKNPVHTAAFNTSVDIARLRITNKDEGGLTTDFDNLTITLGNSITPRKVLGSLGAKFLNAGIFTVDLEAQMLFTSRRVLSAIRSNRTVTLDFILTSDDGVIGFDLPAVDLGGGGREFPRGESVLLNTTVQSHKDATLGTSIGISIIPVPIPAAT